MQRPWRTKSAQKLLTMWSGSGTFWLPAQCFAA